MTHETPRIHPAPALRKDPNLEQEIVHLINEGYRYIAPRDTSRWDADPSDRLPTAASLYEELGENGFVAVAYDPNNDATPIACAAAALWKRDLEGGGQEEGGWEIKMVTSLGSWMGQGFAGRCIDAVVEELKERYSSEVQGRILPGQKRRLRVWVQTVECVNGAYWRKKGWVQLRAYEKPVGHWGSKVGYRLLVLLREFEV